MSHKRAQDVANKILKKLLKPSALSRMQLELLSRLYNVVAVFAIFGELSPDEVHEVIQILIESHDILLEAQAT